VGIHHFNLDAKKSSITEIARHISINQIPCPAVNIIGTMVIRRISTGAHGRYASA
jgi:hypothetical protein